MEASLNMKAPLATVDFDLSASSHEARNLGEEWFVEIEAPRRNRFLRSLPLHIRKGVKLFITDIVVPDCLCVDSESLFSIRLNGEKTLMGSKVEVETELTALSTSFQLFLEPQAIKDCTEVQTDAGRRYEISFTLNLSNAKTDELICASTEKVSVAFHEVHSQPRVNIELYEKYRESVLFTSSLLPVKEIGKLIIENPAVLSIYPALDCTVKFHVFTVEKQTLREEFDAIWLDVATGKYGGCKYESAARNIISCFNLRSTHLNKNERIEIPLIADFRVIGNPYESDCRTYMMEAEVEYHHHGTVQTDFLKSERVELVIRRNAQKADLRVYVKEGDNKKAELTSASEIRLAERPFLFSPLAPLRREIVLQFHNHATEGLPHSGVIIGNFAYEISFSPETTICTLADSRSTVEDVFGFGNYHDDMTWDKLRREPIVLESKPEGGSVRICFGFSSNAIKDMHAIVQKEHNYHVEVLMDFSFDYWLNDDGDSFNIATLKPAKRFEGKIVMPVHQLPNPEWLGIDFGTSAIVGGYAGTLLDLHTEKRNIYGIPKSDVADEEENRVKRDGYEVGTPFLSSNIILRKNARVDKKAPRTQLISQSSETPDYHSLVVALSPTAEVEAQNARLILPCLKLMMGYEDLPELERLDDALEEYYEMVEGEGGAAKSRLLKTIEGVRYPTSLAKVDKVFEEVYRELFVYFIAKCLPAGVSPSQLNRLVLTIPNTFTPRHISSLKKIVDQSLSGLMNLRDICFVSESDSVACHYLNGRARYNRGIGRELTSIGKREVVLVYDMGAGTLDLTLFVRTVSETADGGQTAQVDVLGKIGIAKAGNYLDYLLAVLIAEKIDRQAGNGKHRALNFINTIDTVARLRAAMALKEFIKHRLKPALSDGTKSMELDENVAAGLGMRGEPCHIDIEEDVMNQSVFKDFLADSTVHLIENFFKFLDFNNEQIDTLIFSGRSSKLKCVQNRVLEALDIDSRKSGVFAVIDMGAGSSDMTKTAVVEGAIAYAGQTHNGQPTIRFNGNSVTACYGIIYQDIDHNDHYLELFNPRKCKSTEERTVNGITTYAYRTEDKTVDLSHTGRLMLVQTYSAETEQLWSSERRSDYISVVSIHDIAAVIERARANLRIEVDLENNLRLIINGLTTEGISPNMIDLSNPTISKSLWPMLGQRL